ncbi:MAG TPA: EAL domain-containing protein [Alphaproteobacteria bacterium]|nr:EAL domain-containing protein [Alphaproteobacteria bacterium]
MPNDADIARQLERYDLAARAAGLGVWDCDPATGITYYSQRARDLIGLGPDASRLQDWLAQVHDDDGDWLAATFEAKREGSTLPFRIEHRVRKGDGWRWLTCRGVCVPGEGGAAARLVGAVMDITERKAAEERLRLSEERYALAAKGANDGLWDWQIEKREVYFSPRCSSMLGYPKQALEVPPETWFERVLPEDVSAFRGALVAHLKGATEKLEHEFRLRHADGSIVWVLIRGIAVRDDEGRAVRVAGSLTDITARKRTEYQLLFDAVHDHLTGLPNRTLMVDRAGQALERQRAGKRRHFAIVLLNLDRFKTVNDSLGPVAGDQVLMTIAGRLERARRPTDTLARLGGDEFAVLLNDCPDVGEAAAEAERLTHLVAQPVKLTGHQVLLTASAGLAVSSTGYEGPEDMLRDASLAMYRARSGGRARVEVFDRRLREQAMEVLRVETDLRQAIVGGHLRLHYQPIVALADRRIVGFEALMRWQHPQRGLVHPADFIPLAEETGLIVEMGRWALGEATEQLARWRTLRGAAPLFMSVNVSGKQFRDDGLVDDVVTVLADTGVPAESLKLEITESLLMDDPQRGEAVMRDLKSHRVHLAMDDFGTGYSSLSNLSRFPLDCLKIDRSFVQAIGEGKDKAAIVRIITLLAATLRMEVVAEGIESEGELAFLRQLPCAFGQGYLFGRPVDAEAMTAILQREAA